METQDGIKLVTLKDVAQRIAFSKSEAAISRVARQVRHWTQNDLLKPYGAKQTGTGIPRLYKEEPTLDIAAILLELSRYGATVEIMKSAADALYDDVENGGDTVFLATTDEGTAYLQVAWSEDPETGKFTDAMVHMFEKSPWNEPGDAHTAPSSSILINMNRVLDRLYGIS